MNLNADLLYELLQKLDYRDIANWCRTKPAIANFCKSARGQTLIKDKVVTGYLNSLNPDQYDTLIGASLGTFDELFREARIPIPSYFADRYRQLKQDAMIQFVLRHPELHAKLFAWVWTDVMIFDDPMDQIITNLKLLKDPFDLFNISGLLQPKNMEEKAQIKYNVLKELLITNYTLLHIIKRNYVEYRRILNENITRELQKFFGSTK